MRNKLPTVISTLLVILLALLAGPAAALGLGQISVKSQRNQPLLAEIPIITSDPSELEQLQARLASPDTFRRVGLEPPHGAMAELQFAVALDAQGRPVIRVTTATPVQQPLLTFLLEVDWGDGRLVREYSVLLDAPNTVSAPAQPTIQAPVAAPSNTILRPAETAEAAEPLVDTTELDALQPTPDAPVAETEAAEPTQATAIPTPTPAPAATPEFQSVPEPSQMQQASGEFGPVQRGQTLSEIASGLDVGSGYTLNQTMLALLRANPDAFIDNNINLVKQGAVLRMPETGELAQLNPTQAAAVVRDQIQQWRQARAPVLQPAAVAASATQTTSSPRPETTDSSPRSSDARLAIVPPGADNAQGAGARSGINAGGEGNMLRQDLTQTRETLVARSAEVDELKARVVELEQLQQQQQQLITLKDSEMSAVQQRLAAADRADGSGGMLWFWGGLALLAAAGLGWLLARLGRNRPVVSKPVHGFDTATLAASMPNASPPPVAATPEPVQATDDTQPTRSQDSEPRYWSAPSMVAPTWHSGAQGAAEATATTTTEGLGGNESIELARAYLDLGDDDAARTLLREVLDGRDPAARAEAARMLRDL